MLCDMHAHRRGHTRRRLDVKFCLVIKVSKFTICNCLKILEKHIVNYVTVAELDFLDYYSAHASLH